MCKFLLLPFSKPETHSRDTPISFATSVCVKPSSFLYALHEAPNLFKSTLVHLLLQLTGRLPPPRVSRETIFRTCGLYSTSTFVILFPVLLFPSESLTFTPPDSASNLLNSL